MQKKYKHKITGIIGVTNKYDTFLHFERTCGESDESEVVALESIHMSLIENSNDWQEIKEVKLEVPIGTKFVDRLGQLFTIKKIEDGCALIQWDTPNYMINRIQIEIINTAFKDGIWIIYKEKEFEVLEWDYIPGRSGCNVCGERNEQYYANKKITKVKRLSDGVVFSVGDKINGKFYNNKTITEFVIFNDELQIHQEGGFSILKYISHCKQPLFLDELGNEVFEGDTYYFIVDNDRAIIPNAWEVREHIVDWNNPKKPMLGKVQFKYEKDADKWLIDNKPTFSRKQINDVLIAEIETMSGWGIMSISRFKEKLGL